MCWRRVVVAPDRPDARFGARRPVGGDPALQCDGPSHCRACESMVMRKGARGGFKSDCGVSRRPRPPDGGERIFPETPGGAAVLALVGLNGSIPHSKYL